MSGQSNQSPACIRQKKAALVYKIKAVPEQYRLRTVFTGIHSSDK
jgi:hypothetical protein